MGFWGWRQAAWMAFISVLVVACTEAVPLSPPAADSTPHTITLTLQGSSGAPPATTRPTLAAITATPDTPSPAALAISVPTCLDTLNDGSQCVGLVRNISVNTYGTVILRADLYDDGEIAEMRTLALEQRSLAPQESAPYRFLFNHTTDGPLVLTFGEAFAPDKRLVPLTVRDASGAQDGKDYVVSGILMNENSTAVTQVRALAVVFDGDVVAGYRVIDIDGLEVGDERVLEMRWYGLPEAAYTYIFHADGLARTPP